MAAARARIGLSRRWDWAFLLVVGLVFSTLLVGGAFATDAPSVTTDKTSYGPGDTVTLTGSGWASGETVHVTVDDAAGDAWSHTADLTAAGDGTITDTLTLPDVTGDYTVDATATSGSATATFTVATQAPPPPPPPPTTTTTDTTTTTTTTTPTPPPAGPPTIASDLADYNPGATVTLTGSNWQPGESVHIFVNDNVGQTWSRNVDVTADTSGQISDQFQLPSFFVATYTVVATGATSGTATTTFTDASVSITGANTATVGDTKVYSASISGSCPGPTYAWTVAGQGGTPGTAHISGSSTSSSVSVVYDGSASGGANGTVRVSVNVSGGCSGNDHVDVTVSAHATTLTEAFGANPLTYGGSTSLSGTLTDTTAGAGVTGQAIAVAVRGTSDGSCGGSTTSIGSPSTGAAGNWDSLSYKPTGAGAFDIQASSAGTTVLKPANACRTLTVNKGTTTTTATSSPASVLLGGSATVDYHITSSNGISGNTATGSASVVKDTGPGSLNCTAASTSVSATQTNSGFDFLVDGTHNTSNRFTCTPTAAGSYTFHVAFADTDGNYNGSASATGGLSVTVNSPHATSLTETLTPSTLTYGQQTSVAGTLADTTVPGAIPSASVVVTLQSTQNGSCGGSATSLATKVTDGSGSWDTLSYKPMSATSADILASYAGDSTHTGSTSCKTLTVNEAPSAVVNVSLSNATITTAGSTLVNYKVQSAYGVSGNTVSGNVSVVKATGPGTLTCTGKTNLNTASPAVAQSNSDGSGAADAGFAFTVNSGSYTDFRFSCSADAVGTYTLHVHYNGDSNYLASDSGNVTLTVTSPDSTPPVISFSQTPNGDNNWFKTAPATLHVSAADASGIASLACKIDGGSPVSLPTSGGDVTTSTDGDHTVQCQAVDGSANANVAAYADNQRHLMLDTHAPILDCGTLPTGWQASNVTLNCTASDGTSGLASSGDATFNLSTNVASGGEDASAATGTKTVKDAAGNSATAGPYSFQVDRKAPVVSCGSADSKWHKTDQSVDCTGTDGGSGPATQKVTLSTNVSAGTEDGNASTGHQDICDAVGHCTQAGPVSGFMIDKKAPTLSCDSADGTWHGDDVSIACTASDAGSGLGDSADASFNLTTNVADGTEDENASTGTHQVCDGVGNCDTAGPVAGNKVDKKNPTVSCDGADGNWHANDVSIACTASDSGSGLAVLGDASFNLATNVSADTETANAATNTHQVCDAVSHCVTAGPVSGNKIDKKAPQLSACDLPDGNWHAGDVTLHCSYTDGGSGAGNLDVSLSTNVSAGDETADAKASAGGEKACDAVGNCASSPADVGGNMVDRKAPQQALCDSPDGTWHGANVTLRCHYTDGGSGPATQDVSLTTDVSTGEETADAKASAGGAQACDAVDNCADSPADIGGNRIDRKAPNVTCGSPDSDWHADDQSVHCTAVDGGSGLVDSGDGDFHLSTHVSDGTETDNAQTDSRVVEDAVGNKADAVGPFTFKVDKKAPTVSCGSADTNWHAEDQSVHCTSSDGGSGLADSGDGSFDLSTHVAANTETDTAQTDSRVVQDSVGNKAPKAGPYTFKVDKKAPQQTSCDSPDGTWHGVNVTLKCHYTDGGSGPAAQDVSLSTNVSAGDETADAKASAGGAQACDTAGNCASSPADIGGNMVDRKAPQQASCDSPDGQWHSTDVTLKCHYTDGGSGPATQDVSLTTSVAAGTETSNASASAGGSKACDAVSNCATSPGDIAGNKVDKKGPVVTLTCPTNVILGSSASAGWTASDGGSGVASGYASGSITGLDTSSIGTKTATAPAGTSKDNVNNSSSQVQCTYKVIFNWHGFFQPVDNLPTFNRVKAGQAVPVKFDLGGNQGLNIMATGYPGSTTINCDASASIDDIESTTTAGGSSLTYDGTVNPPVGQYIYVWKTDKAWAGTCRRFDIKLTDGTTHSAYFNFTR